MAGPSGSRVSQELGMDALSLLAQDDAVARRTDPRAWLPPRPPAPIQLPHRMPHYEARIKLPNDLTADGLACLVLNHALDGDIPKVKALAKRLEKKGKTVEQAVAEIAAPWNKRDGPLHMAAAYGQTEMCKFLLKTLKLNVNATDVYGGTPLMFAIQGMQSIDVVKLLLSRGAKPNMKNFRNVTALLIATSRGNYEIAELLLSGGADVDPIGEDGETPLHIAAEDGNERILELLLRHNPDCNRLERNSYTPLVMATFGPSLKCMNMLIQAGADVNSCRDATPLKIAATYGKIDCIRILLDAGADANIPNKSGVVPIMAAANEGHTKCVEILFPHTTPLDEVADWSVEGIIRHAFNVKPHLQDVPPRKDLGRAVIIQGDASFRHGEYSRASCLYTIYSKATRSDDPALCAKRVLCWLHMREKENALEDAKIYKDMQPNSSKSCYLQGTAHLLAEEHDKALEELLSGLNLDFGVDLTDEEPSGSREENPDA